MSKQKCHKAEILLGTRNRYSDGDLLAIIGGNFAKDEKTYALIIDDKINSINKNGRLAEVATEYAIKLKKYGIYNYTLVNGERIRFTNDERIKASLMFYKDVDTFRKTLDAKLKK